MLLMIRRQTSTAWALDFQPHGWQFPCESKYMHHKHKEGLAAVSKMVKRLNHQQVQIDLLSQDRTQYDYKRWTKNKRLRCIILKAETGRICKAHRSLRWHQSPPLATSIRWYHPHAFSACTWGPNNIATFVKLNPAAMTKKEIRLTNVEAITSTLLVNLNFT